eukprot:g2553.t1
MKIAAAFVLALCCLSLGPSYAKTPSFQVAIEEKSGALCGTCTQLDGQALNVLLNYILNAGVVGECGKLCSNLKQGVERDACDVVCGYVGIKTFIELIEKADLDPLYFCQLVKLCPVDDNGAGSVTDLVVSPAEGPQQTTFEAVFDVEVTNHTGAGEFDFQVACDGCPDEPSGAGSMFPELAPGAYSVKLSIDTTPSEPDPNDPEPGPQWLPGLYTVTGTFCMGECGSDKPHSKVFGSTTGNFTITN